MTSSRGDESASWANVSRFAENIQQTGGGVSEQPERRHDLDRQFGGERFSGFELRNRGKVHEILLPDSDLPPDGVSDVVMFLDNEQIRWNDALARIRSRPPA